MAAALEAKRPTAKSMATFLESGGANAVETPSDALQPAIPQGVTSPGVAAIQPALAFGALHKRSPLWEKDSASNSCRGCGAKFDLLRKRHHCRTCGKLHCEKCCGTCVPAGSKHRQCTACVAAVSESAQRFDIETSLAEGLPSMNKTLEEISVGNVIVGSTVKLKSSGELCTVTHVKSDGSVDVRKADGSILDYVGREGKDQFEPIPAVLPLKKLQDNTITELDLKNCGLGVDGGIMLAAVLKSNSSVTKVSDYVWLG